ncbi:signal peptidase II [Sulfitobacter mediterraneus]|uniref:Lipoprotein signal peptidase n=1 Tax=Sulfitobacter mediterraneus TaxID=83219 RepID=A0A061SVR2_9RHOB|nr:signal peptidase II [Sulfitobacter mediterraneus]KAJ03719.1 signal peptidase [Sulfitobacter mediterraneus]
MRIFYWAGFAAFLLDQISKYIVIHLMDLSRIRAIDVMPPILNFRYGENRGINFGILSDAPDASRWVLIGLALVICFGVYFWMRRAKVGVLAQISAGLLVGGALANVADRVIYGYVLDFLNMSCCGINNPFVFNVADIFIFAGAIGLVFFVDDPKKAGKATAKKHK